MTALFLVAVLLFAYEATRPRPIETRYSAPYGSVESMP